MSKRNKERKQQAARVKQARQITAGKLMRLFVKSMAFALAVGVIFTVATMLNVPYIEKTWVQFAVILGIYLVAYPFLMSEFRPKKGQR